MAEMLGLVLAVPGLVDICIRYGQSVMDMYRSFIKFKEELESLIIRVEAHWANLECEILFFAKVQEYVGDRIQLQFGKLVSFLYGKLQVIGLQVMNISNGRKGFLGKVGFALLARRSIEVALSEFAECHSLLQPLLFLLPRSTDPRIDQKIYAEKENSNKTVSAVQNLKQAFRALADGEQKPIAYVPDDLESFYSNRKLVKYTSIKIKSLPDNRHVIIDSIPCQGDQAYYVFRDVRNLAGILRAVDPMTFGIPACVGIVKVKDPDGKVKKLEMVFDVPQDLENPQSLRNLLLSLDLESKQYPINVRVQLAKQLARTVLFVHSANFVHKNFRPETIIVFDHREKENSHGIGFPFLTGFQKVRAASGHTELAGDTTWEQNIYRHPTRQGQFPEQSYMMQHDIYSLGVCLLEIALWKSFVCWDASGEYPSKTIESERLLEGNKSKFDVKEKLIEMARELIPKKLGNRYAEVTILCLKCLDKDDGNNPELLEEDDIFVGVSYIEKVLGKLEEIAM